MIGELLNIRVILIDLSEKDESHDLMYKNMVQTIEHIITSAQTKLDKE